MLGIVRLALTRPYTFIVLALLILIAGPLAALRTPTDIFPNIGIPVISVVWTYNGLPPNEMSGRVIYYYERQLTTSVNDIEHIESQSLPGAGIVKIFFQPNVDIRTATAQVTSISQTVVKQMPPGITPPLILNYDASTVPVMQMALSSPGISESAIRDIAQNFIRPTLVSVPGIAIPTPYGGKQRQITLDLDPQALAAKGLSAQDVGNALSAQYQIIPVGTAKIGTYEYHIQLNNNTEEFSELNQFPVKTIKNTVITLGDVAHVRDGAPPQNNVVRVDGRRAVLMPMLKNGGASTLDVVAGVRKLLPLIQETLPAGLRMNLMNDQSVFVKTAISSVAREGVIAALLTSAMILLFLGSWRSTVIIAVSIPLAVLSAISLLALSGQTLNVMTLGGLALAIGILVDDATVTIENINWHLEQGKDVLTAIMDGARQIVTPAFVSLLCICVVFVPMFMLGGVAGFLFRPMALAVIFAMVSSFVLSRTLVPTLAMYLLKPHVTERGLGDHPEDSYINHHEGDRHHSHRNRLIRAAISFQLKFEQRFSAVRDRYHTALSAALNNRSLFIASFMCFVLLSFTLLPFLGRDFFPAIDAEAISMHVRAPMGTRVEETAAEFDHIESAIRQVIPPRDLETIVDNIGLPLSSVNLVYSNTGTIGPQDGDIQITLKPGHRPGAAYIKRLREVLPGQFPGTQFAFLPADMTSQILNFGAPAPLDVAIAGRDLMANERYAMGILNRMRSIPGLSDVRLQQSTSYPQLKVHVDRVRASQLGITERDVTNSMVASLAGTSQVAPAFWLNPRNGVSYAIVAATPQYRVSSMADLASVPVTSSSNSALQVLGGLATFTREPSAAVVSHYNIMPSFDIYATPQGRDLGAVSSDIQRMLDTEFGKSRPKGSVVTLRGQVGTMKTAFTGLLFGLLGAVVLIYMLIVVNFQSWLDPFVIITALPAALAGIVWMLFATHTTLSVPALTGAIMCMGVATANSILVVTFCRERWLEHGDPIKAALEAGFTRFRPVCMTALAMIIGMLPMALAQEQNSPLGRAVIGGLLFATVATLLFVPVIFSIVHGRTKAN
jgi:multidrug efflux pump subunit AcrB